MNLKPSGASSEGLQLPTKRKSYYFRCPHCGSNDEFVRPSEEASNLGCPILLFWGLVSALLYNTHSGDRIQCTACWHLFNRPSMPWSPFARAVGWTSVAVLLFVTPIYFVVPRPADSVSSLVMDALASLMMLLAVAFWFAAYISTIVYRNKFAEYYRTRPLSIEAFAKRLRERSGKPTPPTEGR